MKKRLLSFALALVMVCTMLPQIPMEVSAASYDVINANGVTGEAIVAQARKYLGVPYDTSGGNYWYRTGFGNTMMFDCSGFVYRVCRDVGLASSRQNYTQIPEGQDAYGNYYITAHTQEQRYYGEDISAALNKYITTGDYSDLRPGDLLFLTSDNSSVSHVVIYAGNGKIVHSEGYQGCVAEHPIGRYPTSSNWYFDATRLITCDHNYSNTGVCSQCGVTYNWQSTYNTDCAGIYEVTLSGGVYLRKDKPYSASTNKSSLIKAGTQVQVLGSVTNHYETDNKWYKVSYNGVVGYTNANNLTWVRENDKQPLAICDEVVGKNGSVYIRGWAFDPDTPSESVAIHVYIDDVLAGAYTANTSRPDVNNAYGCGNYHGFEFAVPCSTGAHSVIVFAVNTTYGENPKGMGPFSVTVSSHTHSYTSKVTTAASCTTTGVRTYTCSGCGASYTETIAATGVHSYGSWTTTQAATCTTTGTRKKTCSSCGDVQTLSIPATGHSYCSWVITTAAGCTTTGTRKKTCSSCGDVQTLSIPATGHSYVDSICTVCGAEEIVDSGTCGDNLTWRLLSCGKLVISGAGAMSDYCFSDNLPWNNYLSFINNVVIEDNVTSIGESAFEGCESLESITIPNSVTSIGKWAFEGCESLENITIPDSVTSIGECTFAYCQNLESITIPDSITSIGVRTFEGCGSLESITIPDSVTSIGERAFAYCENLGSITIPDSITSIGVRTFEGCESLESITIPDSVTSISEYTFAYCENLESISIPDSVTSIGKKAFERCTSLQNVYYTGTKTQWEAVVIGSSNDALLNATVHFVENLLGDADGSGELTTDDAVYLLLSVMFGAEDYPVPAGTNLDFDGNRTVDTDDAVYLLLHVMFGAEDYPLAV